MIGEIRARLARQQQKAGCFSHIRITHVYYRAAACAKEGPRYKTSSNVRSQAQTVVTHHKLRTAFTHKAQAPGRER